MKHRAIVACILAAVVCVAFPTRADLLPTSSDEPTPVRPEIRDALTLPGPKVTLVLTPVFLLIAGASAAFVGWLRIERRLAAPYTRKIYHFLIFTTAGLIHLLWGLGVLIVFGSMVAAWVLYAFWRGAGFGFYEAMARPSDAPRRSLFILIPLAMTAIGGLTSSLLFGVFAFIGMLVAGWGDAIAEPVGTAWGRHPYRVPSLGGVAANRTLEGSAAVLIVGSLAAAIGLGAIGVAAPTAIAVGLACGVAGALFEAISHHGLDNLTVQLAASGMAWLLLS